MKHYTEDGATECVNYNKMLMISLAPTGDRSEAARVVSSGLTVQPVRGSELEGLVYPIVCPVQNTMSNSGPMTVTLLSLWEIRLGWPGRSPVVQESGRLRGSALQLR